MISGTVHQDDVRACALRNVNGGVLGVALGNDPDSSVFKERLQAGSKEISVVDEHDACGDGGESSHEKGEYRSSVSN
jgi:hypothetical protein